MPSNIILTYFDGRWIAESIRLLLKYGNIEFEDRRISQSDWPSLKPSTPTGTLPIYEEDGKVVAENVAIARYVAKKVGLTGSNDWEDLEINSVVDTMNDLRVKIAAIYYQTDSEKKEELKKKLLTETVPPLLEKFDKLAANNGGHLVAKKLTWADFYLTTLADIIELRLEEDLVKKYPNLAKVRENVLNIPQVKAWVNSRPATPF